MVNREKQNIFVNKLLNISKCITKTHQLYIKNYIHPEGKVKTELVKMFQIFQNIKNRINKIKEVE